MSTNTPDKALQLAREIARYAESVDLKIDYLPDSDALQMRLELVAAQENEIAALIRPALEEVRVAGFNEGRDAARVEKDAATPLCPIHKRIADRGKLEMSIGALNCVACSLGEREELLNLLAPLADGSKDSTTALREIVEFWDERNYEDRIMPQER